MEGGRPRSSHYGSIVRDTDSGGIGALVCFGKVGGVGRSVKKRRRWKTRRTEWSSGRRHSRRGGSLGGCGMDAVILEVMDHGWMDHGGFAGVIVGQQGASTKTQSHQDC